MFLNLFAGFGLAVRMDALFFWIGLVVAGVCALRLGQLRCPRCSKRVFHRTANIGGMDWKYGGGNPLPNHCSNCRLDFRRSFPPPALAKGNDVPS
jgi:hypothetical protein